MSRFSEMLVFLRKREGLSQKELGEKLGLTKSTISMYECGNRKPSYEALEAIADYFNINMGTLTGQDEEPRLSLKRKTAIDLIEKLSDDQIDAILKLLGE